MKIVSSYLLGILALLCITSCKDQNIKLNTIIEEDGSCIREFTYSNIMSQSARDCLWKDEGVAPLSYPIPDCICVDSMMGSHTEINGDTVTTVLTQLSHSVEEMCEHTPLRLNGVPLKSSAKLEKHFRWFYTEYTFTETFKSLCDNFSIKPNENAEAEIVNYWFTGQPNILKGMNGAEAANKLQEIEPLITKWFNDNVAATTIEFMMVHYDSIKNPPVSKAEFMDLQDSLTAYIVANSGEDILNQHIDELFSHFFHSDAYSIFFEEGTPCYNELSEILSEQIAPFFLSLPYTLQMPGTIIEAGQGSIVDGIAVYKLTGERLIPQDYVITATSRVTNIWTCIVSIIIILGAIGIFWWTRRKSLGQNTHSGIYIC